MNKKQIVIIIETDDGITFGAYVDDSNTFLFTFKEKEGEKFETLNETMKFHLMKQSECELFTFGWNDIVVMKSDIEIKSTCSQNEYYNYKGKQCALIGRKEFIPKHIQVWKMIETEETKKKKKEIEKQQEEDRQKKYDEEIIKLNELSDEYRKDYQQKLSRLKRK